MTRWGKIAGFGVSVSRLRAIGPKFIPSLTRGSTRTESGARHEPRLDAGRERRGSVRNARCRAGHARSAAGDAVEWGAAGHAFGRCYCEPDRCRASLALGIVPRWSSSRACREAREERVGRGGLGQPPRHKLRGQEDARLDPLRHNGPPAVWCRLPHTPPAQRKAGSPIKSGMTQWGKVAGFGATVSRLRAIGPKFIPSLTRGSTRTDTGRLTRMDGVRSDGRLEGGMTLDRPMASRSGFRFRALHWQGPYPAFDRWDTAFVIARYLRSAIPESLARASRTSSVCSGDGTGL